MIHAIAVAALLLLACGESGEAQRKAPPTQEPASDSQTPRVSKANPTAAVDAPPIATVSISLQVIGMT